MTSETNRKRATDAVDVARSKADADPLSPTFHFHPPSQWMNAHAVGATVIVAIGPSDAASMPAGHRTR